MKTTKLFEDIFGDLHSDINKILPTITKNLAHKVLIIDDGSSWVTGKNNKKVNFPGVYIHRAMKTGKVMYVGKSSNSVGARQSSHSRSFAKPTSKAEMSGRKYNEWMEEQNITKLAINPVAIDMTGYTSSEIDAIEAFLINELKPVINW
mgnify:FL=1